MPKGIAQFTITDFNDVNISTTAPLNPVKDQLWLDSSLTPNLLKRYNGSSWVNASVTPSDIDNAVNNARTMAKLNGIELLNLEYMRNAATVNKPFLLGSYTIVPATEIGGNANEQNYIKIVNGTSLYTPYIACNPNTAQYFKVSLYNKDTNIGTLYVQCCYYDKDKVQIATNEAAVGFSNLSNVGNTTANVWNTFEGYIDALSSTDIRQRAVYMRVRVLPRYSGQVGTSYIRDLSWKQTSPQTVSNQETRLSTLEQTATNLDIKFSKSGINLIRNSRGYEGTRYFYLGDMTDITVYDSKHATFKARSPFKTGWGLDRPVNQSYAKLWYSDTFEVETNTKYKLVVKMLLEPNVTSARVTFLGMLLDGGTVTYTPSSTTSTKGVITEVIVDIDTPIDCSYAQVSIWHDGTGASGNSVIWVAEMRLFEGTVDFGWRPYVGEIYSGVTSIDECGVAVSHTINDTKTNMTSEGFYLKDNLNNTIASLGMINGVGSLLVSDITSPSILKVASWLGTKSIYVAPTKTGDGSGRDVNNKCTSIRAAILNALNGCMVLNDGQNLVVEVAGGSYSEYCAIWDVRGAGTIRINLAPTVVWNGMFNLTNDEITIFIEGNRTGINSNDGAMINPSNVPDGVGVWVNKCKLVWVNGIRSIVTRKPSTWPNFLGITGGSNAILTNSDISNYQSPISVDMVSRAYMDNCRGSNNDLAGIAYSGSYLGVNGQIPANGSFAENFGGLVVKTNTVQTTSCNPALAPTFVDVTQNHTFSTISYRSIRSDWDNPGLFAQSGWSPYAPWTGYAYFSNIKSWTDGRKTGATLKGQIYLQRKSTSHGVNGPVAINLYGIRNSDGALISYGSPCSLSRGGIGGSGWFPVDSLVTDIASGYIKETVVIKGSGNSQYAILENNCQLYISTTFSVRA